MAAQITIEAAESDRGLRYRVTVQEGNTSTQHLVSLQESYRNQLAGPDTSVEQLLRKSFEFLLAREAKESILKSFDLRIISRYFPEYEKEIRRTLSVR